MTVYMEKDVCGEKWLPGLLSPGTAKFILPQPAGNVPFHRARRVSLCTAGRCEDVKGGM
jgi:hypothetical protein